MSARSRSAICDQKGMGPSSSFASFQLMSKEYNVMTFRQAAFARFSLILRFDFDFEGIGFEGAVNSSAGQFQIDQAALCPLQ
jgi:hypothetical protein